LYAVPSFDNSGRFGALSENLSRSSSGNQSRSSSGNQSGVGRLPHPLYSPNHFHGQTVISNARDKAKGSPKTLRQALFEAKASPSRVEHPPIVLPDSLSGESSDSLLDQEDSLHSTSERNYANNKYMNKFCELGRARFASKQSFQEGSFLGSMSTAQSMISSVQNGEQTRTKGFVERTGYPNSGQKALAPNHSLQETSYLGSISTNQSMISNIQTGASTLDSRQPLSNSGANTEKRSTQTFVSNEPRDRTARDGHHLTVSPGPSLRSSHSLAQSIISVSPRNEGSATSDNFGYLARSSKSSGVDPKESHSREEPEDVDPKSGLGENHILCAPSGISMRSSSPPGFVFNDEETDDGNPIHTQATPAVSNPITPGGNGASLPQEFGGKNASASSSQPSNDIELNRFMGVGGVEDASFRSELRHGDLKADSTVEFESNTSKGAPATLLNKDCIPTIKEMDSCQVSSHTKEDSLFKDRSLSTKETALTMETSLRTGLSSLQNPAPPSEQASPTNGASASARTGLSTILNGPTPVEMEGSTSIRSGLSGLKSAGEGDENDTENSKKKTESSVAIGSMKRDSVCHEQPQEKIALSNFPDTILEEEEDASGMKGSKSEVSTKSPPMDGEVNLSEGTSGSKSIPSCQSHQTGSASAVSASANSGSAGSSTLGGARFTENPFSDSDSEPATIRPLLPPLSSGEDQLSSSQSGNPRWWKGKKKYGMKVPKVIKKALSKASPKHGTSPRPGRNTGL